jgi:hypothetical protein
MPRKLLTVDELTFGFADVRRAIEDKESDLGCAVLCGAHVEKWLGALLRRVLKNDPKFISGIFGSSGVLENCGAQNDIAYAIDLISEETHANIERLNKIRNEFAHSHKRVRFRDDDISSRCQQLTFYHSSPQEKAAFRRKYIRKPRKAFSMCAVMTGACLTMTSNWSTFVPNKLNVDRDMPRFLKNIELGIPDFDAD